MVIKSRKLKVISQREIDHRNNCIDEVIESNPSLAYNYRAISERVNEKFKLKIEPKDVNSFYDTTIIEPNKGYDLDTYLTYKNAGMI